MITKLILSYLLNTLYLYHYDFVHKFSSYVRTTQNANTPSAVLRLKAEHKMWLQICASCQMMLEIVILPLNNGSTTAGTESANSSTTVAATEMETASVQDKSVKLDVALFKVIKLI